MLDAGLEYGESIGLLAVSDQSDGYYWLSHSFPADESVADVFVSMTSAIRSATGIAAATIREKPIKLPTLPTLKTAMFDVRRSLLHPACSANPPALTHLAPLSPLCRSTAGRSR